MVRVRKLSTERRRVRCGHEDSNSSSDRRAAVQRQRLSCVFRIDVVQHVLSRQLRRRRLGRLGRLFFEGLQFGEEVRGFVLYVALSIG